MKRNRWIQSATLAGALGIGAGAGALAATELALGRVGAYETLPVSVPLTVTVGGGEQALAFSVSFDAERLRFQQAVLGDGAGGASLVLNLSQADQGRVGLACPTSWRRLQRGNAGTG
ncbi:MAG: hypothetical protein H7A46_08600 [Verrucomicrobiales bacterium]|nr:hypothetical protein [Verrucomicrobiales bacterium]